VYRSVLACLLLAGALASCSAVPELNAPTGTVLVPLTLSVSNQTTLPVTVAVNQLEFGPYEPGSSDDPIDPRLLPAAPWHVEAKTPSGRVLLSFDVDQPDVWRSADGSQTAGAGARADLSCGRLDVWVVYPLAGPAPPQSFPPGDCDP